MTLRKLPPDAFVRRIKNVLTEQDKRFAFFLGAGCSISSGIPGAASLVRDVWLPKLRDIHAPDRGDVQHWAVEFFPEYDSDAPARVYGNIIDALFLHPEERQREIERLCESRFPGFGYAVLARMMEIDGGKFNVALTTNFDDLIADALYLYTSTRPLIIHHESLASYIRPTRTRPLVVKLHGDHRLSPQNTSEETERLKEGISRQVRNILHDRGLIIMGYAGNDAGIEKMLDTLPAEALPLGVYWVSSTEPDCALSEWLQSRNAIWVEHADFDQIMLLFRDIFDLKHPDDRRFESVFREYRETYQRLSGKVVALPPTAPASVALKEALDRTDRSFPHALSVVFEARRHETAEPGRAEEIYRSGIEQHPDSPVLLGSYAVFLQKTRHDAERAEEYFRRALDAAPRDVVTLGNYAVFLESVRKDSDRAEEYYRRAVEADPQHANNLGNYARFLNIERKDWDRAEEYHRRAVEADPQYANHLGNYAVFLEQVRKDWDRAEEYYRRAVEADPRHATHLGNYAGFLAKVREDWDRAEDYFRRAVEADPQHVGNLANYALFLQRVRKDADRAEEYFRRAVEADPQHLGSLANYALFLQRVRKDADRAEEYYRRAVEVDPQHVGNLANYAVFLQNERDDADRAEEYFRRAVRADPHDASTLSNYAGFLLAASRDVEAMTLLDEALRLAGEDANRLELRFYEIAHQGKVLPTALAEIRRLVEAGVRSPGWNFEPHILHARNADPELGAELEKLARVITEDAPVSLLDEWPEWQAADPNANREVEGPHGGPDLQ